MSELELLIVRLRRCRASAGRASFGAFGLVFRVSGIRVSG